MKIRISQFIVGLLYLPSVLQAQPLSGTKTIGGTGYDYATFTDAVSALTSVGVSGQVIFNVRTGTYSEQINMPVISGAGPGSEIIFQSETGINTDVTLTYAAATNPENYTLMLNGTDYITFRNMTISSTGSSYGRVIIIVGEANNNKFLHNRIIGVSTTDVGEIFALIDSYEAVDTGNLFSENYLQDGSYGFYLFGTSSQNETGNIIENNILQNQCKTGMYIRYQDAIQIIGNLIESNTTNSSYQGMYIRDADDIWQIEKNQIILPDVTGGTGIYFNTCNSVTDTWSGFINNFLVVNTNGNPTHGIRIYNCNWLNIFYNNVEILGNYSDSRAITISGTTTVSNIKINNNIFANNAAGYAIYCESTDGFTTDYNNLISWGGNVGYWNSPVADLTEWKSASLQGAHSVSVDPLFISETDLHISNTDLKSGTPLTYPVVDIDGESRDVTNPCMGADEFIYTALAGLYTIGTTDADFVSFNEAVTAMINGGVRDEVVFEVQPGTYTEQVMITSVKRASEINTITFKSPDPDSTVVTLTYSPAGTGDNFTIKLDNTSYITFENLTFTTGGTTYGTVMNLTNGTSDIYLKGNRIIGSQSAETNYGKLIDGMDGTLKQNLKFENNLLQYGTSGVDLANNDGTGTRIAGNLFLDLAFWNIRLDHCDEAVIERNIIRSNLSIEFSGIFFYYCDSGLTVTKNLLYAPNASACTGIYLYKSNAGKTNFSIINNNIISLHTGGTSGRALYNRESSYCRYSYNNIHLTGSLTGSSAIYLRTSGSNIYIKNNIFSNFADGYSIYSEITSGIESDYNDLHTSGSNLGYWGTVNQTDLSAWQTASGLDASSVSVDPQFPAADDPHFPNPLLNDAGIPVAEVTDDIDGEMRNLYTPDIGADEFCLPPEAENIFGCTTRDIPELTAVGDSILWYSDGALTTMVHSGNNFPAGHTAAGTYAYYATQTINESESQADTVILTINTTPVLPFASDTTICYGESTPDLTASGTDLKWYDDETLTNQVNTGSFFTTGETGPGIYTFYVTQTQDGCESDPDTSVLTIHPIPDPPEYELFISCFGDTVPDMIASGENVKWYSDETLTNLVHIGDIFSSEDTLPGYYAYHPTQTVNGCESGPGFDTLWIKPRPDESIANNQSVCIGETVPDLTATGTDLKWYEDAGRETLLQSGNTYSTGETEVGIYPYYVTQTVNGCESLNKTVALAINDLPVPYILEDKVICEIDTQEYHLGTTAISSHSYSWTSSQGDLTSSEANPVVKPVFSGSYKYFLTETIDSTGCLNRDTVTITIHPDPMATVLASQILCHSEIRAFQIGASAIAGNSYSWVSNPSGFVNAEANPTVTPTESRTYILTETIDLTGCNKTDSVTFTINPNPDATVLADQTICHSEIQEFQLSAAAAVAGHSYLWTSNPAVFNSTQSNPKVTPQVTTAYTLTETINATGCDNTNSVTITVNPNPVVSITAGQNPIDQGSSTTLNASGAGTYQWSPATGLSNTTGNQVTADPDEITTYIIEGTNNFGCTGTDTIILYVYCKECSDTTYFKATDSFNFGCKNNLYMNNMECSWTILPSGVDTIYLSFDMASFDIKQDDYIKVYNGQDATKPLIGEYNNNNLPPANIKGKNAMHIRFVTDEDTTGTGFQAKWSNTPFIVGEFSPQLQEQFRIYPNPASDKLYIESDVVTGKSIRVFVYNNLGQLVMIRQLKNSGGQIREEVDISDLTVGMYYIRIVTSEDIYTQKVIKE